MTLEDDLKEARQRLLDFANTATAEEGWCHSCGDFSADNEAPALTRLRAEVESMRRSSGAAARDLSNALRRAEAAEKEAAELRAIIDKVRAATPTLAQLTAASARHDLDDVAREFGIG